jgi:hypothetical protein
MIIDYQEIKKSYIVAGKSSWCMDVSKCSSYFILA